MADRNDDMINPADIPQEEEHTKEFKIKCEETEQTKEFRLKKEDVDEEGSEVKEVIIEEPENSPEKAKIFSSFKALPKYAKIAIIAAAVSLVVLLVVVITVIVLKSNNIENNSVLVYKKGNECVIRIDDKETTVSDSTAANFKAEKDAKRVYYTIVSSFDSNYYDLYYVQLEKGEISKPSLIDCVVEYDYEVIGNKVYYLKYNETNKADDGCICDIESKKTTVFSSNVNGIYYLNGNGIYFTKPDGENLALYGFFGETPQEVSRNVTELYCYPEAEKPHILYTTNSGTYKSASSLFIAYDGGEPETICDNAYMVAFDEYKPGGNLYYFTSSEETVSWSYVISDEFAESDKLITKPNVLDFFGGLFGISADYNEAYVAYQDKLIRDEIRKALDETVTEGGLTAPVFSVFAYSGEKILKVAQKVDPSRVYSYAAFGEPKIVFENTSVKENETDMATLSGIAARSGMEEVILYAKNIVANSVESHGMALAIGKNGGVTHTLNEYDKGRTKFRFSENGEYVFAIVSDTQGGKYTLYSNKVGGNSVEKRVTVAANIKSDSVKVKGDSVVYLVTDTGKNTGDIFSFNGSESTKLSNSAEEFIIDKYGNVFIQKNIDADTDEIKADYYAVFEGKEIQIGSYVLTSSFKTREDGSASFVETDGKDARLMIYWNGETTEVCKGVSQLLLYK